MVRDVERNLRTQQLGKGGLSHVRVKAERPARTGPPVRRCLGEQLAADQHAADFAGAGADLVQLGVAPQAADRVLVDVAVAAQRLDRLAGHPGGLSALYRMAPAASLRRLRTCSGVVARSQAWPTA
jgi:hypothetical protein